MEKKDVDLRIMKTKKAIYKAFEELINIKNIEKITIKEIAEKAKINRKTFYSHYESIEAFQHELLKGLTDEVNKIINNPYPHTFKDTLVSIYQYLCNLPTWYQKILCTKDNPFGKILTEQFLSSQIMHFKQSTDLNEINLYIKLRYIAFSFTELFKIWFELKDIVDKDYFIDKATGLICKGEQYIKIKDYDL